jgi:hypothetical protein
LKQVHYSPPEVIDLLAAKLVGQVRKIKNEKGISGKKPPLLLVPPARDEPGHRFLPLLYMGCSIHTTATYGGESDDHFNFIQLII